MRTTLNLPAKGWMTGVRLLRTWALILVAQYFAFTLHPSQGLSLLGCTFQNWTFSGFAASMTGVMAPLEWLIAGTGCAAVLAVDWMCEKKIDVCGRLAGTRFFIRWPVLLLLILVIAVFGIYGAGYDGTAFLYTQF